MIRNIAVLGAGTMGVGMAHLFAEHAFNVSLFEPNEALLPDIRKKLQALGNPRSMSHKEASHSESSVVHVVSELPKAVSNADLIVEAVPENLMTKREVYRQLTGGIRKDAIIASNTSTFALETLAEDQPFKDRMIITHFFNPPHVIPLVEIVGLSSTSPAIIDSVVALMRGCGKTPVVLNRDIPGFIANRLQAALMREACFLLESGVADVYQIDKAVTESLGLRWAFKGPFEIADLGGLDIWSKVTGHLFPTLSSVNDAPTSMVAMAKAGQHGIKSGHGYYRYPDSNGIVDEFQINLQQLLLLKTKRNSEG